MLLANCGLLLGRPSSPWLLGVSGGGPLPPVPRFPGSSGFPGFPEFSGFGDPDLDGVFGRAVPLPFVLVSVAVVVVVPLILGFGP